MRAISLWEPWASAIAKGLKKIETRGWSTNYRGLIAIHAAKTRDHADYFVGHPVLEAAFANVGISNIAHLSFGCVVATARLVDCCQTLKLGSSISMRKRGNWCPTDLSELERELGNYASGRFAWILDDVQPLAKPVPAKGAQGFFQWEPPGGATADSGLETAAPSGASDAQPSLPL